MERVATNTSRSSRAASVGATFWSAEASAKEERRDDVRSTPPNLRNLAASQATPGQLNPRLDALSQSEHGAGMTTITVPVDERWMASNGFGRDTVEPELRLVLAAKLYELRKATLAQAAEMAGLTLWQFTDSLPRLGVSIVNSTDDQLREDLFQG